MDDKIKALFGLLNEWRKLPAYKLEPRADIFFAYFLPKIMHARFPEEINKTINHDYIIPEFHLKKLRFDSNKVDYAVIGSDKVYLVELKTTIDSIAEKQADYLKNAKEKKENLQTLVEDVYAIRFSKNSHDKHKNLIKKIHNIPNIGQIPLDYSDENTLNKRTFQELKKKIEINGLRKIVIVYILPDILNVPEKYLVDVNKKTININGLIAEVITYDDIIKAIEDSDDLANLFCESLRIWKNNETIYS